MSAIFNAPRLDGRQGLGAILDVVVSSTKEEALRARDTYHGKPGENGRHRAYVYSRDLRANNVTVTLWVMVARKCPLGGGAA